MSSSTFSLLRPSDDSTNDLFGTEAFGLGSPVDSSALIFSGSSGFDSLFDPATSNFNPSNQQVDPTNTGDTGGNQNVSTPATPSQNNPETAGGSSLGAVLNNAINAGFSAWQLASLPRNTPRTVQTQVGPTRVVAGSPTLLNSLVGPTTSQGSQLLVIGIIVIIGLLIYKSVAK